MSDAAVRERAEHLLECSLAARRVAIEARDARLGKKRPQPLLDLLGARADEIDVLRIAFRAGFRHAPRKAAVVAEQAVLALVIGERDAAVLAKNRGAATPAQRKKRIAAPVDQHQRLRPGGQPRGQSLRAAARKLVRRGAFAENPRADPRSRRGAMGRFSTRASSRSSLYLPWRA